MEPGDEAEPPADQQARQQAVASAVLEHQTHELVTALMGAAVEFRTASSERHVTLDGNGPHGGFWDVPVSVMPGTPSDVAVAVPGADRCAEIGWAVTVRVYPGGDIAYYVTSQPDSLEQMPPFPQRPLVNITASVVDAFVARVAAG